MEKEQKDEIIEELWKIKDQFSSTCNKNIRQLVQLVNEIAEKQGFDKTVDNTISNIA
jgi:hypothetical protein